MFKIIIHVANAMPAILDYRTREKAEKDFLDIQDILDGKIHALTVKHKDDYGVIVSMPVERINYVLFVDVIKQQEIQVQNGQKS